MAPRSGRKSWRVPLFLYRWYILEVNPAMLADAGMDSAAVFTATAVSAAVSTLFMAFFTNYPIALASFFVEGIVFMQFQRAAH